MRQCDGCNEETAPDGDREALCYDCLYMRYIAYRAENAKNFKLLCQTEQQLARELNPLLKQLTLPKTP